MQVEALEINTKDKRVSEAAEAAVNEFLIQYHNHSNRTERPSMSVLKIIKAKKNGTTYRIGFQTATPVECGMFLLEICLPPYLCRAEVSRKSQNQMNVNKVRCERINNESDELLLNF